MSTLDSPATRSNPSTSRDLERVLVVHAHPDDETIVTGALLATLVDEGAAVTVVTCTRGELGEVMPDDLAGLRGEPTGLAVHRQGEIADAMRILGVRDHRFLGADGARTPGLPERAYRDSGMEWGADGHPVPVADIDPAAFCSAPFGEIVSDLAAVVHEVRPTAIVSYDEDGGYGHPDHVRVNRAARRTAEIAEIPYFAITGGAVVVQRSDTELVYAGSGQHDPDVVIDGSRVFDRKVRALQAYRTQVAVVQTAGGPALEFPHGAVEPITAVETFRLVAPVEHRAFAEPAGMDDLGPLGRGVTYGASLVCGALFGAIGTIAHQETFGVGPFSAVPLGAVLSLVMVAALLIGLRLQFQSRLVPLLGAIGVVGLVMLLTLPQSSGSVLIPGNVLGYAWLLGPVVIGLLVVGWPRFGALRAQSQRQGTQSSGRADRLNASPPTPEGLRDSKEQSAKEQS